MRRAVSLARRGMESDGFRRIVAHMHARCHHRPVYIAIIIAHSAHRHNLVVKIESILRVCATDSLLAHTPRKWQPAIGLHTVVKSVVVVVERQSGT